MSRLPVVIVCLFAAVACASNGSRALIPVDTKISYGGTKLAPDEVVYVGFGDVEFPVAAGEEVELKRVEVLGVPEHVTIVDIFAAPIGPGSPLIGVTYEDGLPQKRFPIDAVTLSSDSDNQWQILIGAAADAPGKFSTEGLVLHYTAGGKKGEQRYDYAIDLAVPD